VAAAAFAVAAALVLAPVPLEAGGLHRFWAHTIEFQQTRGSPFSVWGLYGGLGLWQAVVKVGAVLLALVVVFAPRRRDVLQVAALAAAVVIATQLGITHWFYLYLAWFLPPLLLVLLAGARERGGPA
jgi:hypothetical protein